MKAERQFALPETVDGDTAATIARCAEDFESHLAMLEKECACSGILAVFKQHPKLEAMAFQVRDDTDDEPVLHSRRSNGVLDVETFFSPSHGDEDTWDETCDICLSLSGTMTRRLADFYEGLRIARKQVLSPEDTPIFPDLRTMRLWIEFDLK